MSIDVEAMIKGIRAHTDLLLMIGNEYIQVVRDPAHKDHIAFTAQIQVAAEGDMPTYILWTGPVDRGNLNFVLDQIEGADLRCIVFSERDVLAAHRLIQILMGEALLGKGTSDYVKESTK